MNKLSLLGSALFVATMFLSGCGESVESADAKKELTLDAVVKHSVINCRFKSSRDTEYKEMEVMHKPGNAASLISGDAEMTALYEVHETSEYSGLDYNIYKIHQLSDPTRVAEAKRNFGFFVTSYTENELQIQTTRGNATGSCTKS